MSNSIVISIPAGKFSAYMAEPAQLPAPAIVVGHEVFGVNADLRATCDELAAQGFIAVCPDLFWRLEPGVDLSFVEGWDHGLRLYRALDLDTAVQDVMLVIDQVRLLPSCNGKVGVMGFCLGGLIAYLVAARGDVDAAVAYHGGRTEEFLSEAKNMTAPLLMHLGELDEFIPPTAQESIIRALRPQGAEIYQYEGCWHAFARHGGAHYDKDAATLANGRTLAFFRKHLTA